MKLSMKIRRGMLKKKKKKGPTFVFFFGGGLDILVKKWLSDTIPPLTSYEMT